MWICQDQDSLAAGFTLTRLRLLQVWACRSMSVLDDFVRMRLYRERASEFELLAETEASPGVRLRYRIVARHYRELAEREERADKARMAEQIKRAKLQRQQAEAKATLPARNDAQFFLIAAE